MIFCSVIIPTYNRAKLIREALASVLNQDFQDFEIVVVDDFSQDETAQVVGSFGSLKIRYFRLERNVGSINAKNFGVLQALGKYVCFLDSDDTFLPGKLAELHRLSLNRAGVFFFGGWEWADFETGNVRVRRCPDQNGKIAHLPRWCYNIVPDMIDRDFMLANPYDEKIRSYEHFEILIKAFQTKQFAFTRKILSRFRDHSGERTSKSLVNRVEAIEFLFLRRLEFIRKERGFCAQMMLTKALYEKELGRQAALSSLVLSIRYNPMQIKAYFYFFKLAFR